MYADPLPNNCWKSAAVSPGSCNDKTNKELTMCLIQGEIWRSQVFNCVLGVGMLPQDMQFESVMHKSDAKLTDEDPESKPFIVFFI